MPSIRRARVSWKGGIGEASKGGARAVSERGTRMLGIRGIRAQEQAIREEQECLAQEE
jgi:hypothetical protein